MSSEQLAVSSEQGTVDDTPATPRGHPRLPPAACPRPAIFLDRDGTINVEVDYLHRLADFELIPGVTEAIKRFNIAGYAVVVVTNQSGIARGLYDLAAMQAVHDHLQALLAPRGAHVDAFFFCPHHPDFTGPCTCRKPAPGMLLVAAQELGLDLQRSWMIGDTAGDIDAGRAAGCRTILVRTGYGAALEADLGAAADSPKPTTVVDALPEAADYILAIRT